MSDIDIRKSLLAKYDSEYNAIAYEQEQLREAAFIGATLLIAGIEVNLFTPYHYLLLDNIGSPFIKADRVPDESDVGIFVWIVSTEFVPKDETARSAFLKKIAATMNFAEAIEDITEYLTKTYGDFPFPPNKENKLRREGLFPHIPFYSPVAGIVDGLSSEYGWEIDYILSMPYILIFQFMKAIAERRAEGKPVQLYNQRTTQLEIKILKEYVEELDKAKDVET